MPNCNQNNCQYTHSNQMYAGRRMAQSALRSDCDMPCNMNADYNIDSFSIAMAYVPWQQWQNIYEPAEALSAGTLFKDLDLRFYGSRGCRK